MRKIELSALVLLCALWPGFDRTARAQTVSAAAAPSARVIVKYRADSSLLRLRALAVGSGQVGRAEQLGLRAGVVLRAGAPIAERSQVVFADGVSSQALAARLSQQGDVEYAVVDERRRATGVIPNDPLYLPAPVPPAGPSTGQWYLKTPDATIPAAIDAPAAWSITQGSPSVVVAVLDTGVRFDHEDLLRVGAGGNLLPGYDMVSDMATANDGDGRDADPSDPGDAVTAAELAQPGGPFQNCDPSPSNSSWHGTQIAGLVGAITDNAIGMASVGRTVRVLPVRVLGKCGGFDSDIIAGIRWAAGLHVDGVPDNPNPARVINLSLGSEGSCHTAYRDAAAEVGAVGALVVASAGNSAGHAVASPANCPGIMAIAALRHAGSKVGFSDIGPEIALSAPGGNCVSLSGTCLYPILTTSNAGTTTPVAHAAGGSIYTDSRNYSLGTSFSVPLVVGTAALMLSVQPALTPTQLRDTLRATARPFPTTGADPGTQQCTAPQVDANGTPIDQQQCYCTTTTCGAGMLDAGAAVRAAVLVQARIDVAPNPAQASSPVTLSAQGSLVASGRSIASYRWTLLDGGGIVGGFSSPADAPSVSLTPGAAGAFVVQLSVTDSTGAVASVQTRVQVDAAPVTVASGGGGGGALGAGWLVLLGLAVLGLRRQQ